MRPLNRFTLVLLGCVLVACAATMQSTTQSTTTVQPPRPTPAVRTEKLDTQVIEARMGSKGTFNEKENVFKVSIPREDVAVTVEGRKLEPFMGLTSWAAFTPGKCSPCMVMGDLVLFQDELAPAMTAALDNGLAVTALHNHFAFDDPQVFFMHIGGEGATEDLARGVRATFDRVKAVRAASAAPLSKDSARAVPAKSEISADKIDAILGAKGQSKDGMYKAVFGREVSMPCDCIAGKEMGVNTWAAFAGNTESALVDGDFVTIEGELQPVLKALCKSGIAVVAIHSHMEGESPRTIFLHYWSVGRAEDLARGVRAALDAESGNSRK